MNSFQLANKFKHLQVNVMLSVLMLAYLIVNIESKYIETSTHYHHNVKRQDGKKLMPTLTVDVGPQSPTVPNLLNQENTVEYYFPEGASLFNFSCVIKHPSFRYKIQITREQELNSGIKSGPIELIDSTDMEQVNPLVKDERTNIIFEEFTGQLNPNEPSAKYLKASFLIKDLKLKDSGAYKCMYSSLVKQIKVVVYQLPKSDNIKFPVNINRNLELNKPTEFVCSIENVYPKPVVTFLSTNNAVIENDLITVEDTSVKTDTIYAYSSLNKLTFTPKFTDNNKNLTCSVFGYGAENVTLATSYRLNIQGTELITDSCPEIVYANVDDINVNIECLFFSNPKIEPEWETKVLKTSTMIAGPSATIETGISTSLDETTTEPNNNILTQIEEPFKITSQDDESSNYVASLQETSEGSGIYKAIVRIKNVREEDFKNFTIRIINNQVQIEQKIRLRKRSEYQVPKELVINQSSAVGSGAKSLLLAAEFHSKILFLSLTTIFTVIFSR